MHVCKYANIQESRYDRLKLCKFLSMWLCNHVNMPPYEYAIISYYHTRVQLENFSYLASWTTKWNDYEPRYDKPLLLWPDGLLKFCRQQPFGVWKLSVSGAVGRMTARGLKCVWKIFWRCLEYAWKVSLISFFKVSGKLLKMTRIQVQLGILGEMHPSHPPTTPPNLKFVKMTLNQG